MYLQVRGKVTSQVTRSATIIRRIQSTPFSAIGPCSGKARNVRKAERERGIATMNSAAQPVRRLLIWIGPFNDDRWNGIVLSNADKNAHHPVTSKTVGVQRYAAHQLFNI